MKGLNSKESILAPFWRSQLIDSRNWKDLSDNEQWIWIREKLRRTQTYVWCIFDVISKNNTTCKTQWHGASFDSLTAPDEKGHKTCKITTIFQTVVDR